MEGIKSSPSFSCAKEGVYLKAGSRLEKGLSGYRIQGTPCQPAMFQKLMPKKKVFNLPYGWTNLGIKLKELALLAPI